jgi:hypothetical protein
VPMIQKLLASAGKMGTVVTADKPGEGLLPVDGQTFQSFEKFAVQQRLARHSSSF